MNTRRFIEARPVSREADFCSEAVEDAAARHGQPGIFNTGQGRKIADLPGGPLNHHWTKDLIASLFPSRYARGAFIGQHGSWNRNPKSGYKVIFVPFVKGKPSGGPQDILTGFLNAKGEAMGRPVGVAIDTGGALLVADDVGNKIWRVIPTAGAGQ